MALETLSATQRRLATAGFVDALIAREGHLLATPSGRTLDPADLFAAEIIRFEGDSDPNDEAILVAVAGRGNGPIGTFTVPYGPNMSSAEAEVLRHLHPLVVTAEEISSHDNHEHVSAVFPNREQAEAAVAELREIGLGSEHLGVAVHQREAVVFEHDEDSDLAHSAEAGVAAGSILGSLAGMLLFGMAIPALGVGGILAMGTASAIGGAMTGAYHGLYAASPEFDEHARIRHTPLADGEVLVVACSHSHRRDVEDAFKRHGGRLAQP